MCYGINLIIESIIKIFLIILIGRILNQLFPTILILIIFCSLRSQAGGFHFKTNAACFLSMLFIVLTSIYANQYNSHILIFIYVIEFGLVLNYAPSLTQLSYIYSVGKSFPILSHENEILESVKTIVKNHHIKER